MKWDENIKKISFIYIYIEYIISINTIDILAHKKSIQENDRRSASIGNIIPINTAIEYIGAVRLVYTVIYKRQPWPSQAFFFLAKARIEIITAVTSLYLAIT